MFLAIPVNTVIYGCESWTLTTDLWRKNSSFSHRMIHWVLGINMFHVQEFHIQNEHIWNCLSVPDPLDIVRYHQFNQLGKFALPPWPPPPWPPPATPLPGLMGAPWTVRCTRFNLQKPYVDCPSTHIRWGCPRWQQTTCLLAAHGMIARIVGTAQPRLDQSTDCRHTPLPWMAPMLGPGISEEKYATGTSEL